MKFVKTTTLAVSVLALAACGYQPLYTETASDIASVYVGTVEVTLDDNRGEGLRRPAQLVNQKLKQTFTALEGSEYTLNVKMSESTEVLAVRSDGVASRTRLNLAAKVALLKEGEVVFDTVAEARSPYRTEASPYSTEAGERNARKNASLTLADEIIHRVNFFLYQSK